MKNRTTLLMLSVLVGVLVLHLASLGFVLYLTWPITELSVDKAAALGGSFGFVSSLFSGLAFWGLIWTIILQRQEIRRQRIEAKRTRIASLVLDEANHCLSQIEAVRFHAKMSMVFPMDKPFTPWQLFYNVQRLVHSIGDDDMPHSAVLKELAQVVVENFESLEYFYQRLGQACDLARYLLADAEIPVSDLNEIKRLFFSRFSEDIFLSSEVMKTVLDGILDRQPKEEKRKVFDPVRTITIKIGSINEFHDCDIDEDYVRSFTCIFGKGKPNKTN
jgi:hypothetical protein